MSGGQRVKAISLWEPWASLMRTGAKTIETRSWPTRYRGPLLICAAVRKNLRDLDGLLLDPDFQEGLAPLLDDPLLRLTLARRVESHHLLFGMAVALVTVVDCCPTESLLYRPEIETQESFGDFSPGRFGWVTKDLRRFAPFPITGRQGLFNVEPPSSFWEDIQP